MNSDFFTAIRKNHALEHATISILLGRLKLGSRLMGRATSGGFYIYGDVPTERVKEAAADGLDRLKGGEEELAISPFCGTNIAVTGILTGIACLATLGRKNRLQRLPHVILAAIVAVVAAQPLGRLVQKYATTSPRVEDLSIAKVIRKGSGGRTVHRIETSRPEPRP